MGERCIQGLGENTLKKKHLEDLGIDGRII
jgi:hypothetical protein